MRDDDDSEDPGQKNSMDEIAHRLRTQDNRATAWPLFVVQQRRRISGLDPQFDFCDFEWHTEDHKNRFSEDEIQEVIRQDLGTTEIRERDPHEYGYVKVNYQDIWEFVSAHFTAVAAQEYIDANSHNLTEPRIFVESQYR